jgi:hypothetical protein
MPIRDPLIRAEMTAIFCGEMSLLDAKPHQDSPLDEILGPNSLKICARLVVRNAAISSPARIQSLCSHVARLLHRQSRSRSIEVTRHRLVAKGTAFQSGSTIAGSIIAHPRRDR